MSHIYYELYYHIIWTTKEREALITGDIESILKNSVSTKIKRLGGEQLEFNNCLDHCHLLSKIPPQTTISDFVGQVKGYASYIINKELGENYLKWQQGFGVLSLSEKGIPFVRKYIQNQKQHHKENTVIKILEYTPDE